MRYKVLQQINGRSLRLKPGSEIGDAEIADTVFTVEHLLSAKKIEPVSGEAAGSAKEASAVPAKAETDASTRPARGR